jgi:hypothetical protein
MAYGATETAADAFVARQGIRDQRVLIAARTDSARVDAGRKKPSFVDRVPPAPGTRGDVGGIAADELDEKNIEQFFFAKLGDVTSLFVENTSAILQAWRRGDKS